MKVLLVEDEEFIRDLFKRQLDLSGFTTDAFGNGQDGLSAISKNAYDLVLLDIMLPDINGLQILQNIRSNPTTKGVAVVLLTNLGQDAVIKQGFELGADGYLVKAAYTPDQIVQEVKNIMQKKQSQKGAAPTVPTEVPPAAGGTSPAPAAVDATASAMTPPTDAASAGGALPAFPGQAQPASDPLASANPAPMPSAPIPDPMTIPAAAPTGPALDSLVTPSYAAPAPVIPPPSVADVTAGATSAEMPAPATPTTEVTPNNS